MLTSLVEIRSKSGKAVSKSYIEKLVNDVFADADKTKNGCLTYASISIAVLKHPWLVDANIPL